MSYFQKWILKVSHDSICEANTSKKGGTGGISERKYRAMSRHCLLMDTPTAKYTKEAQIFPPLCSLCLLYWFGIFLAEKTFCVLCDIF